MTATTTFRCKKRACFDSKLDADIELMNIQARDNGTRERIEKRSYYCDLCDCWHLTSQEKRAR